VATKRAMERIVKRRGGLGRGLDALLPGQGTTQLEDGSGLRIVAVDDIVANPNQPRRSFEEEAMAELTRSIEEVGVLQPLLVREGVDGNLELVAGERRWRAARAAGLVEVPVLVVETDERGSLERALVENIHRSDLDPIEEAAAYRQLLDEAGLTHEQLGERLGKNRVTITNALRLLDLPPSIQALIIEGRLTGGHGRALLVLEGSPFQERLATRVAHEQLSVRETEDLVKRYQSMTTTSASKGRSARPPQVSEAQRILADKLQTRVRVDMGKRKGRIVLDFVSLEELDRLLGLIVGSNDRSNGSSNGNGSSG
jgi:ParB family transcriptional regulator, chromosome partitioning protein